MLFRMAKVPSYHHVIKDFEFFKFKLWTYKADLKE